MKTTKSYKVWQLVYPVGMYYVVSSLAYFALEMLLGQENETYMLRQIICAVATIPFILRFYRQDKKMEDTVYGKKKFVLDKVQIKNILFSLIMGAAFGIAVNNILAMTPLLEVSAGFKQANDAFFGGRMLYELLGSCLLVPIAEELLFRGVVYKRLRMMLGIKWAIVLSAVIFGTMHFNLVQFLYAGIVGLLLACILEKTGYLYAAILGHMAANTAAVIRQETGWLDFTYEPTVKGIGVTLVLLLAVAVMAADMVRENKCKREK